MTRLYDEVCHAVLRGGRQGHPTEAVAGAASPGEDGVSCRENDDGIRRSEMGGLAAGV